MSTKLIIWVPGRPNVHGHKRHEYLWNEEHKCFIHGGKEYTPQEFNEVAEKAIRRSEDMHPCVRAIVSEDAQAVAAPPPAPKPRPTPIVTITPRQAHEITEAEAVTVLMRLAPHRLKKGKPTKLAKAG